jgi:hypothetical protein
MKVKGISTKLSVKDIEVETWFFDKEHDVIKYINHISNYNWVAEYNLHKRTYFKESNLICFGKKK